MHVDEADTPLLKSWVVKRLEDISDADSDVLADYVLALVKSDDPENEVRQNTQDSLQDFLKDNTTKFVDDVFSAIDKRTYDPNYKPPPPAAPPIGPSFNPPAGPSAAAPRRSSIPGVNGQNGANNGQTNQSRKRNFTDTGLGDGQGGRDGQSGRGDRAVKQMRRGDNRGRGDAQMGGMGWGNQNGQMNNMSSMPTPPGFPPMDPNNPLAAMIAMSASMGFPMPNFPGSPGFGQSGSPPNVPNRINQRCRDYDTKGFCAMGTSCPYEHGTDSIVVGQHDQYDPTKSPLEASHRSDNYSRGGDRGRGRGRGRGDRGGNFGGKARAAFSHAGPNYDKSNATIVVEQIPEDKFDETTVRGFFSGFGNIVDIQMQAYKHLAIVKYDGYNSARAAYDSPKVIFDNRFVKVYWYKPDGIPVPPSNNHKSSSHPPESKPDEEMIDPEEFAKKQAEAQQAHETKQKSIEEARKAKEELDAKIKAQAEERKKLMEKLAAKTGAATPGSPAPAANPTNGTSSTPSQTEALRAKLAELEAEATRIGLDPMNEDTGSGYPYRGRGRGGYRARGSFPPRGRGYDPSWRGGYRGRGTYGAPRGGAVKRLDNRPKKVIVAAPGIEEKAEALREWLFDSGLEYESVEPLDKIDGENKEGLVVGFKERYLAESFVASPTTLPQIGPVSYTWHAAATPATATFPPASFALNAGASSFTPSTTSKTLDNDTDMSGSTNGHITSAVPEQAKPEVDYDVADDEDQW